MELVTGLTPSPTPSRQQWILYKGESPEKKVIEDSLPDLIRMQSPLRESCTNHGEPVQNQRLPWKQSADIALRARAMPSRRGVLFNYPRQTQGT